MWWVGLSSYVVHRNLTPMLKPIIGVPESRTMLQEAGLRRTASRVAVLCELASAGRPLSHAEVVERLEGSGFGAPTIFRCLGDMAVAGIFTRIDLGDHVWRFGFRGCGVHRVAEHPHFICVDCGRATCLPGVNVNVARSEKSHRDFGDVTEIVLKGRCPSCR